MLQELEAELREAIAKVDQDETKRAVRCVFLHDLRVLQTRLKPKGACSVHTELPPHRRLVPGVPFCWHQRRQ
eukprot:SAG11_NODE_37342_length_257_cov_0.924051_1_plen_71_part_10